MGIGNREIVLGGNQGTVADPLADDVDGKFLGQLGFPAGPQILKEPGPGLRPRPMDDPLQLGPEILVGVAIVDNDVFRARLGLLPDLFEVGP